MMLFFKIIMIFLICDRIKSKYPYHENNCGTSVYACRMCRIVVKHSCLLYFLKITISVFTACEIYIWTSSKYTHVNIYVSRVGWHSKFIIFVYNIALQGILRTTLVWNQQDCSQKKPSLKSIQTEKANSGTL